MGKIVKDMEVRMYKRIMRLLKKSKEKGECMASDQEKEKKKDSSRNCIRNQGERYAFARESEVQRLTEFKKYNFFKRKGIEKD